MLADNFEETDNDISLSDELTALQTIQQIRTDTYQL